MYGCTTFTYLFSSSFSFFIYASVIVACGRIDLMDCTSIMLSSVCLTVVWNSFKGATSETLLNLPRGVCWYEFIA